jgi:hypothetical protein
MKNQSIADIQSVWGKEPRKQLGKVGLPCHSAGMKKSTIPSRSQFAVFVRRP